MKEKIRIPSLALLLIVILFFINPSGSNASTLYGYVCSGDSITCGVLNAIYKIFKDSSSTFYICDGDSVSCNSLNAIHRVEKDDLDTYYVCSGDSIACGFLNDIYTVEIDDADTMYICPGNSIVCGLLNDVYTVDIHDDDTMYVCPGDSIVCGLLNKVYRVELINDTSEYNYDNYLCPENSTYQNGVCTCNPGYVVDNLDKSKCTSINQYCQEVYGANSYGLGENCYCDAGYEWNTTKTACVKNITCPANSIEADNDCVCNKGYEWNLLHTVCVKSLTCPINSSERAGECVCGNGYEWDSSGKNCIEKVAEIVEEPTLKGELGQKEMIEAEQEENTTEKEIVSDNNEDNFNKQKEQNFLASIFNIIKGFFSQIFSWF